jgi:V8-like Glu-specific endopeptidase
MTRLGRTLLVAFVVAMPALAQNDPAASDRRERLLALGMQMVVLDPPRGRTLTAPAAGLIWSDTVQQTPNVQVSVHVRVAAPATAPTWRIKVRDVNDTLVEELDSTEPCWSSGACWTALVDKGEARIELWSDGAVTGIDVTLDAFVFTKLPSEAEGTIGDDDKKEIKDGPDWVKLLAPPVARLAVTNRQAFCTGFLVSPTLVVTNQHCIATDADALSTFAEFKFEKPRVVAEKSYRVRKLEAVDATLDYAVLRLNDDAGAKYGRVRVAPLGTVSDGALLVIVQHPAGQPKMFVVDSCAVSGTDVTGAGTEKTDFGHTCDTLRGSSGAPVFTNPSGALVGLHHWGFDENGKPLNQAVHFERILADIRNAKGRPTLAAEMASQ